MRIPAIPVLAAVLLTFPAGAQAATTLGATPPPRGGEGLCSVGVNDSSVVQKTAVTGTYAVPPGGGVITQWRHQAGGTAGQKLRLRLFRFVGGTTYTAVGESPEMTLTPGALNQFDTRIPVTGGELLGLGNGAAPDSNTACLYVGTGDAGDEAWFSNDMVDPPLNSPAPFFVLSTYLVNIDAKLEADTDHDGYGDESQDCRPGDPAKTTDCVSPNAQIDKRPKKKTDSAKAVFRFSSSDPGATFQCAIDNKPLKPCSSPKRFKKLKERKHRFRLVASDASGNASAEKVVRWKVTG